ncbi:hypothetical protein [Streptomyces aureus]|uniref:hypothetical protein n=1 Tax=Streptomyces aureus TaxID=193461 RepID=UPI0033DF6C16
MWKEFGDGESTEHLLRQAADLGSTDALYALAKLRDVEGDREGAEVLLWQAADHGDTDVLVALAREAGNRGDEASAKLLLRLAADHGNSNAPHFLALMQREASGPGGGDTGRARDSLELLLRHAADHGHDYILPFAYGVDMLLNRLWPNGLDPDGMPTPPWQELEPASLHSRVLPSTP